jgi:hypothetical protein
MVSDWFTDKVVYLTMYYNILEGPLPAGWDDIKVVWFDANQCGTSEVMPPKQNGVFTISSRAWRPNFEGKLLGGHIHDGGAAISITYGPGKELCNSTATYAGSKEYVSQNMPSGGHGHADGLAKNHISSMTTCYLPTLPVARLSRDQVWQVNARYDYDQFPGNKENGKQSEVMAIALMYVAIPAAGVRLEGGAPAGGAPQAAGQPAGLPPKAAGGRGKGRGATNFVLDDTLRWVETDA